MDKRKAENFRVKKCITTALLDLLEEKSISEISISEIIKKLELPALLFIEIMLQKKM